MVKVITTAVIILSASIASALSASTPSESRAAAAAAKLKCTPKIRGALRFGVAAPGYPDILLKVQAKGDKVIDSQGQNATLIISSDESFAESWDFVACDSKYLGLKNTKSKQFYGQLRPSPSGKQSIGKHCLAAQEKDLRVPALGGIQTNVTSSLDCDIDDERQTGRFFLATYSTYNGFWGVKFVGADGVQDKDSDVLIYYTRENDNAPFQFNLVDLGGDDRKANAAKSRSQHHHMSRRATGEGAGAIYYAQAIALLGNQL